MGPDESGNVEIPAGTELDTTLTVEGKAADAKAVGDAIGKISGQNVTLDTTLTQSGKAADAKATGDALAKLEAKIPEGGANYTLPVANANTLGGVKLPPKTDAHTEEATVGPDGRVWVKPPAQSITEVDGVGFINHVGNLYSPANRLKEFPVLGDNVMELLGGTSKCCIFRAKPNTTYVITFTNAASMGNIGQANAMGICTQAPGSSSGPVSVVSNFSSGGYGKYRIIKTNSNFYEDTAYLIWQAPSSADLTDVAIYEGDSIEGYDTINPYSLDNGTSTSNDLVVRTRNLDPEISRQLNRGNTAVQPDDLTYTAPVWSTGNFSSPIAVGDTALGSLRTMLNSVVMSKEWLDTQIKLGEHYAHCPSVNVKNGIAYISAFQNAKNTTDTYVLPESSTELFLVDIATMTQTAQYKVAGHGDTVAGLTFAYGSGACQSIFIDDTTLRTVFVAQLQNAEGVDEWYQCYRDFNITDNTFGDIGLCQLLDADGDRHAFTTANASLYTQLLTDTSVNTNIVCQPAKIGNIWYVACGCQEQWPNMPILTTEDWITFQYWATPSVEGNSAHYEMAIATTVDGYLYTATRQTKGKNTVQLMKINPADKSLAGHIQIPTGNDTRPFIMLGTGAGANIYIWHILTTTRSNSAQISVLNRHGMYLGATAAISTPPCVYPSVVPLDGGGYFASYMIPYGLYCCKFGSIERYDGRDTVGIAAKLIELVGG